MLMATLDEDGDGTITLSEFQHFVTRGAAKGEELGVVLERLQKTISEVWDPRSNDQAGEDSIRMHFQTHVLEDEETGETEEVEGVDKHGLRRLLRAVNFKVDSKDEIKRLFRRFDRDRNGVIEWSEFEVFMMEGPVAFDAQLKLQLSASKADFEGARPQQAGASGALSSCSSMGKLFENAATAATNDRFSPPVNRRQNTKVGDGRRADLSIDTDGDELSMDLSGELLLSDADRGGGIEHSQSTLADSSSSSSILSPLRRQITNASAFDESADATNSENECNPTPGESAPSSEVSSALGSLSNSALQSGASTPGGHRASVTELHQNTAKKIIKTAAEGVRRKSQAQARRASSARGGTSSGSPRSRRLSGNLSSTPTMGTRGGSLVGSRGGSLGGSPKASRSGTPRTATRRMTTGGTGGGGGLSQAGSEKQLAQAHELAAQAQAALAKAQTRFAHQKNGAGKQEAAASLQAAATVAASRARALESAAKMDLETQLEASTSSDKQLSPAGTGRRSELSILAATVRAAFQKAAKGIQRDVAKGNPVSGKTEIQAKKDPATGQMSCRETEALRWLFSEFDSDSNEVLDANEFRELVSASGHTLDAEEHRVLMGCFDESGTGEITLMDFVTFVTGAPQGEEVGVIADRIRQSLSVTANGGFEGTASAAGLKKLFDGFDANKDGEIGQAELKQALARTGVQLTAAENSLLMRRIDTDKSGRISFAEFVNFIQPARATPLLIAQIAALIKKEMRVKFDPSPQRLFDIFDEDSNGYVGLSELRVGVNLHLGLEPKLTDVEVDNLMNELDKDGDGAIEAREFEQIVEIYGGGYGGGDKPPPSPAPAPAPIPQADLKGAAAAARAMVAAAGSMPMQPATPTMTRADESGEYSDADGSMAYSMTGEGSFFNQDD
jgi:Ca2+-binding EF-hand superfamily protein